MSLHLLLKGLTIGVSIAAPVGPSGCYACVARSLTGSVPASSAAWVRRRPTPSTRSSADSR